MYSLLPLELPLLALFDFFLVVPEPPHLKAGDLVGGRGSNLSPRNSYESLFRNHNGLHSEFKSSGGCSLKLHK